MKKFFKGIARIAGETGAFYLLFVHVMPTTFLLTYTASLEKLNDEVMAASFSVLFVLMMMAFIVRMGYLIINLDIDLPDKKDKQKVTQMLDSSS